MWCFHKSEAQCGATQKEVTVVRNNANELVTETTVQVAVTVLNANNAVQYAETHANVQTNRNGLLSLMIGDGISMSSNTLADVEWPGASLRTVITLPDNTTITNVTPVNSVPYALYADNVDPDMVSAAIADYIASHNIGGEDNVQADWNESNQSSDAYIRNKPDFAYMINQINMLNDRIDSLNDVIANIVMPGQPTVTTSTVSNITTTTATCGGEVTADGGAEVIERGVCWSVSENPTTADSHTTEGTGLGTFTSNITNLTASTTYHVRAYATNSVGTVYGNEVIFTTIGGDTPTSQDGQPCPGTLTVTDHEGNIYNTVQIGNQCWMRENLRTTKEADGTPIPAGDYLMVPGDDWSGHDPLWEESQTAPYYYDAYKWGWVALPPLEERGYLYNWPAAMLACPTGWHLPSDAEWTTLTNYVSSVPDYWCGGNSSNIAKALASTTGWLTSTEECTVGNNQSANNATGFSAVPAKFLDFDVMVFTVFDEMTFFWSSTNSSDSASSRILNFYDDEYAAILFSYGSRKNDACSVRCLRDSIPSGGDTPVPQDTTSTPVDTTATDGQPCPSTPTVTDHEGNVYATVQIGDQCWMRDNLRTTTSPSTGTYLIPTAGTVSTFTGKQAFWYNNDSVTYAPLNYGLLYNWNAAVDTFNTAYGETSVNTDENNAVSVTFSGHRRGICPAGWHLPSNAEWTQLENYVDSQSEYQCGGNRSYIAKALSSSTDWYYDADQCDDSCAVCIDSGANNATSFSAVPAGACVGSSFGDAGHFATFWSSTQSASDPPYAYDRGLYYYYAFVTAFGSAKDYGYSVRCLRD